MSNPNAALKTIGSARRQTRSERVLILEGTSDVQILCALLGGNPPPTVAIPVLDDVALLGLNKRSGSGKEAVEFHVSLAADRGIPHVYGIVDGDGAALDDCLVRFDSPFTGPLFQWPAYSIEGMLALGARPDRLGIRDDASFLAKLDPYLPLAALNRMIVRVRDSLGRQRLTGFNKPSLDAELHTEAQLKERVRAVAADLENVQSMLDEELETVRQRHARGLQATLTAIDGKWLTSHLAGGGNALEDWCDTVRAAGGVNTVKDWWRRCIVPGLHH